MGNRVIRPCGKGFFHTIYIEFAIAAELLHAEDICVLFFHIPGYFFAGISGLISIKGIYVVSGDGECREGGGRRREPDDPAQISPIA